MNHFGRGCPFANLGGGTLGRMKKVAAPNATKQISAQILQVQEKPVR